MNTAAQVETLALALNDVSRNCEYRDIEDLLADYNGDVARAIVRDACELLRIPFSPELVDAALAEAVELYG